MSLFTALALSKKSFPVQSEDALYHKIEGLHMNLNGVHINRPYIGRLYYIRKRVYFAWRAHISIFATHWANSVDDKMIFSQKKKWL